MLKAHFSCLRQKITFYIFIYGGWNLICGVQAFCFAKRKLDFSQKINFKEEESHRTDDLFFQGGKKNFFSITREKRKKFMFPSLLCPFQDFPASVKIYLTDFVFLFVFLKTTLLVYIRSACRVHLRWLCNICLKHEKTAFFFKIKFKQEKSLKNIVYIFPG